MNKLPIALSTLSLFVVGTLASAGQASAKSSPAVGQQAVLSRAAGARGVMMPSTGDGSGMAALKRSENGGKYLFVLFFNKKDQQTEKLMSTLQTAVGKISRQAEAISIDQTDPSESAIVKLFGVEHASLPLLLSIAPNGAVTLGTSQPFDERKILNALVSPGEEKCLKALQNHSLVFICLENGTTRSNTEALRGVREFQSDTRFGKSTEIINIDPSDPTEKSFLSKLKISQASGSAKTVLVAPPGVVLTEIEGATTKEAFVSAVGAASSGCGPGGCASGKCK